MYRPGSSEPPRRRWLFVLRVIGFSAGTAGGAFGLWRLVTSSSARDIQIGILIGIWGLAVALISLYGTRVQVREVPVAIPVPVGGAGGGPAVGAPGVPGAPGVAGAVGTSQELDLRKVGEIERAAVAAARREFQAELHAQLEHHFAAQLAAARDTMQRAMHEQVQVGVAQEVAGLRDEVAALRNDLLEKVGGQMRLERIETTRLIGSDLEALQHELRRLREFGGHEADGSDEPAGSQSAPGRVGQVVVPPAPQQLSRVADPEPAVEAERPVPAEAVQPEPETEVFEAEAVEPEVVEREVVEAEVVEAEVVEPEVVEAEVVEPEAVTETFAPIASEPEPVAESERTADPEPEPEPEPVAETEPEPAGRPDGFDPFDPFASLPRITPFEYELDPLPPTEAVIEPTNGAASGSHRQAVEDDEPAPPARGRRHRADDDDNDMLAKILARERH